MLKIGEKLNSSIPRTLAAMKERDDETLLQLIRDQEAGGAAYLDINTALVGETEAEELAPDRFHGAAGIGMRHHAGFSQRTGAGPDASGGGRQAGDGEFGHAGRPIRRAAASYR